MEEEEEAETEGDDESKITVPVEGTYSIIATLKNSASAKPEFVEEIVEVRIYRVLSPLYFSLSVYVSSSADSIGHGGTYPPTFTNGRARGHRE